MARGSRVADIDGGGYVRGRSAPSTSSVVMPDVPPSLRRLTRRGRARSIAVLALAAIAAACDRSPDDADAPAAVVRDSAGIMIVENPPEAQRTRVLHEVDTASVVIAREADGTTDPTFESVLKVVGLSDGSFVALDMAPPHVRAFGADGVARWNAVGRGNGPNELSSVGPLARIRGDSLIVDESQGSRAILLDADGTPLGDLAPRMVLDTAGVRRPVWPFARLGDGSTVGYFLRFSPSDLQGSGSELATMPFVLLDRDGTLPTPLGDHPVARMGRGGSLIIVALSPYVSVAAGESEVVSGWPESEELRVVDTGGSLIRLIRTSGDRRPPTAEEADVGRDQVLDGLPVALRDPGIRDRVMIADSLPHFARLVVGTDGRIWRERFTPARPTGLFARPDSVTVWDVLAPSGEWLGIVSTPPSFYLTDAGPDWIVGSFADELNVQVPRRYRLRAAAR